MCFIVVSSYPHQQSCQKAFKEKIKRFGISIAFDIRGNANVAVTLIGSFLSKVLLVYQLWFLTLVAIIQIQTLNIS